MLAELEQVPIDLNQATVNNWQSFPGYQSLAIAIINYRHQIGSFESIEELILVENVNPDLIPILRKYLTVSSPKVKKFFSHNKNRLSWKIQQ